MVGRVGTKSSERVPRTSVRSERAKPTQSRPETPKPAARPAQRSLPTSASSVPACDLELGAKGPEVKALQRLLVGLGCLSSSDYHTSPGTFGPRTEEAVRRFQSSHGVPPTGFFGPMTRAALAKSLG